MKKLLIVVDMQKDFVDGALGTKQAQKIVPVLKEKLLKERALHTEIIFTKDTHEENYLTTQEGKNLPVKHCIRGTDGWELIEGIYEKNERIVQKPSFGSVELPQYAADADVIELVGLCTDICVISNAMLLKAFYPEKKIQIDASCCAGVTQQSHQNALKAMQACQIEICNDENHGSTIPRKVTVQTFGNFEVFADGELLQFSRSKSKELLAYLVDRRGAGVTNAEIALILFEDKMYSTSVKNQVQTVISELKKTLKKYGIEEILVRKWNSLAINTEKITCDYYDFIKGNKAEKACFAGEYMSNYSWAEYTNGYLLNFYEMDE